MRRVPSPARSAGIARAQRLIDLDTPAALSIAARADRIAIAHEKSTENQRMKPGHDGEPPRFVEARGSEIRDPKTGAIVRQGEMTQQNINCDRVTYLFNHDLISNRQYLAAQRLEKDWEKAEIVPIASTVLVGACSGSPQHPNDDKVAAMKRFGDARDALGRWWPIIDKVVIEHKSVEKASAELRIHAKRGIERLDAALFMLADHYKIG